jgi:hypothetical protein
LRTRAAAGSAFHGSPSEYTIAASRNYKVKANISRPGNAAGGVSGKSPTQYLLVSFEHVYPVNSAVPIAGFDEATAITAVSGMDVGFIDRDRDGNVYTVYIFPKVNKTPAASMTVGGWTAAGRPETTDDDIVFTVVTDGGGNTWSGPVYKEVPWATPTAAIDYAGERLTGLDGGALYKLGDAESVAVGSGYISIKGFIPNHGGEAKKLELVKEEGEENLKSPAQTLTLPARPAPPTGSITPQTSAGGVAINGSIAIDIDIDPGQQYEYKLLEQADSMYTLVTDSSGNIANLDPGVYYVRVKAETTAGAEHFASAPQSFRVHKYGAIDFGSKFLDYGGI